MLYTKNQKHYLERKGHIPKTRVLGFFLHCEVAYKSLLFPDGRIQ